MILILILVSLNTKERSIELHEYKYSFCEEYAFPINTIGVCVNTCCVYVCVWGQHVEHNHFLPITTYNNVHYSYSDLA